MTFSANYKSPLEEAHSIIETQQKSVNKLWLTDGECLYFYPVALNELKDLFEDEKVEWNAVNIARFILNLTKFFQDYESNNSPIDRKIVKALVEGKSIFE